MLLPQQVIPFLVIAGLIAGRSFVQERHAQRVEQGRGTVVAMVIDAAIAFAFIFVVGQGILWLLT